MHKLFLTDQECEVIKNSRVIIRDLGGFPSMEDGSLESVIIERKQDDYPILKVSLIFDIKGWYKVGAAYGAIHEPKHKRIKLEFNGLRSISVNADGFMHCGEIKFGNTHDRGAMHQDVDPKMTPVVPRPFCTFYIHGLLLEFEERECVIEASYVD